MSDFTDYIVKVVGRNKPRKDKFYRCWCNSCGADRGYLLKPQHKRPMCNKCAQIGKIRNMSRKACEYDNVDFNDWIKDKYGVRKFAVSCITCNKKRYVREIFYRKECRSCSNHRIKIGKPSSSRKKMGYKAPVTAQQYKLRKNFSCGIRRTLKKRNFNKNNTKTFDIVDYSFEDLKKHLEAQFKPGMTWDNYGSEWHIDHAIPDSWFEYESYRDEGFKKSWSLSNLQPMWASENCSKQNRYSEVIHASASV